MIKVLAGTLHAHWLRPPKSYWQGGTAADAAASICTALRKPISRTRSCSTYPPAPPYKLKWDIAGYPWKYYYLRLEMKCGSGWSGQNVRK